jgi:divinyl protochlorophyllide a 8-vinyl-reductase
VAPAGHLAEGAGRIGPNALHQLVAALDRREGRALRDGLCRIAGVRPPPPDAGMWPEAEAAALHRAVREERPGQSAAILAEAGTATADYILAHRIPAAAQWLLRRMPGALAGPLLARAVAAHAWTFAGSGRFRIAAGRPLTFEIAGNPLVVGETASAPVCHWHAAVFRRLFARLAWREVVVVETACCACGDPVCRFVLRPRGMASQVPVAP